MLKSLVAAAFVAFATVSAVGIVIAEERSGDGNRARDADRAALGGSARASCAADASARSVSAIAAVAGARFIV